jgi:hypothetical protein
MMQPREVMLPVAVLLHVGFDENETMDEMCVNTHAAECGYNGTGC